MKNPSGGQLMFTSWFWTEAE